MAAMLGAFILALGGSVTVAGRYARSGASRHLRFSLGIFFFAVGTTEICQSQGVITKQLAAAIMILAVVLFALRIVTSQHKHELSEAELAHWAVTKEALHRMTHRHS